MIPMPDLQNEIETRLFLGKTRTRDSASNGLGGGYQPEAQHAAPLAFLGHSQGSKQDSSKVPTKVPRSLQLTYMNRAVLRASALLVA
jgi:hypothetical protein